MNIARYFSTTRQRNDRLSVGRGSTPRVYFTYRAVFLLAFVPFCGLVWPDLARTIRSIVCYDMNQLYKTL